MDVLPLVALVAGSAAIAGAARRTPVPAPLLLVAVGLGAAYVPGVPDYTLDPHIVLPLILPPLLLHGGRGQLRTSICGPTSGRWPCCRWDMSCSRPSRSAGSPICWCPICR